MVLCCAYDCSHVGKSCSMFRFPQSPKLKEAWIRAAKRRKIDITNHSRLCNCYFRDGSKKTLPEFFSYNKDKKFKYKSPEKRQNNSPTVIRGIPVKSSSKTSEVQDSRLIHGEIIEKPQKRRSKSLSPWKRHESILDECVRKRSTCTPLKSLPKNGKTRDLKVSPRNVAGKTPNRRSKSLTPHKRHEKDLDKDLITSKAGMPTHSPNKRRGVDSDNMNSESPRKRLRLSTWDNKSHRQNSQDSCRLKKQELLLWSLKEEVGRLRATNTELRRKSDSCLVTGLASDQTEAYFLRRRIESMEKMLQDCPKPFCFGKIGGNDELVSHYTGLPNTAVFDIVVGLFDGMDINYHQGWCPKKISMRDQIFITLVKLKRNLSNVDLGERFSVSDTTIAHIVHTWVDALHCVFVGKDGCLLSKVPSRFKTSTDRPPCFDKYLNTRMIIDCTEVQCAIPGLISKQNQMFSTYKQKVTGKGLVGIAPNGTVVFVSKLYPGRTSDKEIVIDSKVLDCMEPGDSIMADKGFLISSLLPAGVCINLPAFKETPQFTKEQIDENYEVAQSRIHVERAIQRIKLNHILDYIPQTYLPIASKIFQVCAVLTNFRNLLIRDQPDLHTD